MRIRDVSSDVCSSDLPALAPMNAFLALTGMETLALRMERHCSNALALAKWLKAHPKIDWVSYAGLEDDPYHPLAQRYLGGKGGAVFTFGDRKSTRLNSSQ